MNTSSTSAASPLADIANDLAAGLLRTAMRESEVPVNELAAALVRIKRALRHAPAARGGDCDCKNLEGDVEICIQSLQFHDRLIQQLTSIRQLFGSEHIPGTLGSAFMPADGSIEIF